MNLRRDCLHMQMHVCTPKLNANKTLRWCGRVCVSVLQRAECGSTLSVESPFVKHRVLCSSRAELYRTSAPQNGAQKSPQGPQMEPKWRPKRSPIAKIPLFLLWGREMWLAFRAPIVGCVCCAASVRSWHASACVLPHGHFSLNETIKGNRIII